MGRISYIPFSGTVTNANGDVDFVEVSPADDRLCWARGFCLGQTSETGDTEEKVLDVQLVRLTGTITSGSGGSAGAPFDAADDAASVGYASETMNTTVATQSGGNTRALSFPWGVRMTPYTEWFPERSIALKAKQGQALCLRLATAVPSNVDVKGWLAIEEEE